MTLQGRDLNGFQRNLNGPRLDFIKGALLIAQSCSSVFIYRKVLKGALVRANDAAFIMLMLLDVEEITMMGMVKQQKTTHLKVTMNGLMH